MSKKSGKRGGRKGGSRPTASPAVADPGLSRSSFARFAPWIAACSGPIALLVALPMLPSESAVQQGTIVGPAMFAALLLVFWATATCLEVPKTTLRWGWTDLAAAALILLHVISGGRAVMVGHGRFAVNAVWVWLTLGIVYFLTRQRIRTGPQKRALVAVMIALGATLSLHGYHQYFVSMPAARADYEQDPERALRDAGLVAPPGSPQRRQFEDRLSSTEPTATFALTNSLAGFLIPWLLVAGGALLLGGPVARNPRVAAGWLIALVLLGGCLVLTKSRSGYLAAALGLVLVALSARRVRVLLRPKVLLPVLGVGGVLVLLVVFVGGLDLKVVTEALKSFRYRLEYWQATVSMIAEYPALGCGPGNFQLAYPAYKLAQSSETVADPHNFLLEVWATAGTLAALALMGIGIASAFQFLRSGRQPQPVADPADNTTADPAQSTRRPRDRRDDRNDHDSVAPIYAVAGSGVMLAAFAGLLVGYPPAPIVFPLAMASGGLLLWLLHPWVEQGRLPSGLLLAALVALMLNLLAAGGIGFPGVAQNAWLLLALALVPERMNRQARFSGVGKFVAAGVAVLLAVGCYLSLYYPVLESGARLSDGRLWVSRGDFSKADEAFLAAAAVDPLSPGPWLNRAAIYQRRLRDVDSIAVREAFNESLEQAIDRNPRGVRQWEQIGNWRLELYTRHRLAADLTEAVDAYGRASDLYPNGNFRLAQLAWACYLARKQGVEVPRPGTAQLAEEALRLDRLNPHQEQKLAQRRLYEGEPPERRGSQPTAEQRMLELRNSSHGD